MNWLDFFSNIVASLSWPIVALVAIFVFRDAIRKLLARLLRLKGGGVEAEFEKALDRVEEAAERIEAPIQKKLRVSEEPREAKYRKLCEASPSAAIGEAWREIELAAADIAPPEKGFRTPVGLVRFLKSEGLLDEISLVLLEDLRDMRNRMTHNKSVTLSSEEAFSFCLVAMKIADLIRRIGK